MRLHRDACWADPTYMTPVGMCLHRQHLVDFESVPTTQVG